MLKIVPSNQFKKDLKLARKRGCKIECLRNVVNALANEQKLDEKYHDHGLAGNYNGFRECHVEPDSSLFTASIKMLLNYFYSALEHILIYFSINGVWRK